MNLAFYEFINMEFTEESMEFAVRKGEITKFATEALVVPFFEGGVPLAGKASLLDEKLGGMIGDVIKDRDFEGKPNQVSILYTRGAVPAKRIVLTGMGKKADFDLERLRCAFAKAAQQVRDLNIKKCATFMDFDNPEISTASCAEAIVEGVY